MVKYTLIETKEKSDFNQNFNWISLLLFILNCIIYITIKMLFYLGSHNLEISLDLNDIPALICLLINTLFIGFILSNWLDETTIIKTEKKIELLKENK